MCKPGIPVSAFYSAKSEEGKVQEDFVRKQRIKATTNLGSNQNRISKQALAAYIQFLLYQHGSVAPDLQIMHLTRKFPRIRLFLSDTVSPTNTHHLHWAIP